MTTKDCLLAGHYDTALATLYGADRVEDARRRYAAAIDAFTERFGSRDTLYLCSAPGRTELSGNHTDHNHGRTLAASVQLDVLAVVSPTDNGRICACSEGYRPVELTLSNLSPQVDERGSSTALIRGVAAGLKQAGAAIGGFDAYITSQVPQGSGLSSSAAYEILIGTIFNTLYNGGSVSSLTLALIAGRAENVYFGKPCGLLDQMACATGGAVALDFADPQSPKVNQIPVDFSAYNRTLCIVDTGGSHADLTDDYAAVPAEMKAVAGAMGVSVLRETDYASVLKKAFTLREECGDRALLRAFHFFAEDRRAADMADALTAKDITRYETLMAASGRSSFQFLQNLYSPKSVQNQGLPLALCVAEPFVQNGGAVRVHGGGFAGTVQALLPTEQYAPFCRAMEQVFGKDCCHILQIRPVGGVCLNADN